MSTGVTDSDPTTSEPPQKRQRLSQPEDESDMVFWESPRGRLTPLRTLMELRALTETIDVFITSVSPSIANTAVSALRLAVPPTKSGPGFQHLRRLIKADFLPASVRSLITEEAIVPGDLWMLLCPTAQASELSLVQSLEPVLKKRPAIYRIPAPRYVPLSAKQAQNWSTLFWPTVYKRDNPFGPHPSAVERQAKSLLPWIGERMQLARDVAIASSQMDVGHPVGAVICDPDGRVRAVAGDARNCEGPLGHAVMRAVRVIGEKRRVGNRTDIPKETVERTEVERQYGGLLGDEEKGYLCQDLIVCLTHEPCVMCSMALVHSRVGAVIFEQNHKGGAMRADRKDGHGLFWREELNWRFSAYQWIRKEEPDVTGIDVPGLEDLANI